MYKNSLRIDIDKLVDLAGKIYHLLETNEQNLLHSCMLELGHFDVMQLNILVRKRVLRYMILDKNHTEFQSLWSEYQVLFRGLYRDFHVRPQSPMNDELFASREIIEDAMEEVTENNAFKHVFLQKAYQCFGVDFKPIKTSLPEICLFASENPDDSHEDETTQSNFEESEDSSSHVCCIM